MAKMEHYPIRIIWKREMNNLEIELTFRELISLHSSSGKLFSTESLTGNYRGFIKVSEALFVKLNFDYTPSQLNTRNLFDDALKIGVNNKTKNIKWTVFTDSPSCRALNGEIHFASTSLFHSKSLEGFYYDLTVLSRNPLTVKNQTTKKKYAHQTKPKTYTNDITTQRIKDFQDADQFRYMVSPNTDGLRNSNVYLAGTGSNMSKNKL